jgi:hypothetical protein
MIVKILNNTCWSRNEILLDYVQPLFANFFIDVVDELLANFASVTSIVGKIEQHC